MKTFQATCNKNKEKEAETAKQSHFRRNTHKKRKKKALFNLKSYIGRDFAT